MWQPIFRLRIVFRNVKPLRDKTVSSMIQNLRVQADPELFLLILTQLKNLAQSSAEAATFLKSYGESGKIATPPEWQRSYLPGLPPTSISIERIHREVKRVSLTFVNFKS